MAPMRGTPTPISFGSLLGAPASSPGGGVDGASCLDRPGAAAASDAGSGSGSGSQRCGSTADGVIRWRRHSRWALLPAKMEALYELYQKKVSFFTIKDGIIHKVRLQKFVSVGNNTTASHG